MLIKNNLIAIAIHVCICFILFFPINYIWWGGVWFDRMWGYELKAIIYNWLAVGVITIVALFAYFIAGKLFLQNTQNMLTNILSTIMLAIILIVATIFRNANIWEGALNAPFYPIGATISYFFLIKSKFVFLIMSLLPSLAMWIGIMSKKA